MSKLREKFDQLKTKAAVSPRKVAAGFDGSLDVEAILGKDYWVPGSPPEGLTVEEEIDWKRQQRAEGDAERLVEAQERINNHAA